MTTSVPRNAAHSRPSSLGRHGIVFAAYSLSLVVTQADYLANLTAVGATEPEQRQRPDIIATAANGQAKTPLTVEALASKNTAPELIGRRHRPIFDAKHDWKEYDRVWGGIRSLISHSEAAWADLVGHLDDERYCTTYEAFSGFTYNVTVGDMCREIIARNLSAAYDRALRPEGSKIIHAKLGRPEIARYPKALKAWCAERSKKKLYELQVEMCDWAISVLSAPDVFDGKLTDDRRKALIASITSEIELLNQTKSAIPFKGFGGESISIYSKEKVEARPPDPFK